MRMRTGSVALVGAALCGCFLGEFLVGRPCEADSDCGPSLACEGGYCGGVLPSEGQLCLDSDGDGFGDPDGCEVRILADLVGEGWVSQELASDCDDSDPRAFPGAAFLDDPEACMRDSDGDGWGSPVPLPLGLVAGRDCNDADPGTYPRAAANEPLFDACMTDADGDGWGAIEPNLPAGALEDGAPGTDCDDQDPRTYPGAGYNETIEPDSVCRRDRDEDGYGSPWPGAGISAGSDCDDDDASVIDLSCDVSCPDVDGDGQGGRQGCSPVAPGGNALMEQVLGFEDCDDFSATTFMGAAQLEGADRCMRDADDDGWGEAEPREGVEAGRDCDDGSLDTLCVGFDASCYEAAQPGQDVKVEVMANGGVLASEALQYDYGYVWEGGEPKWLSVSTPAAFYADGERTQAYAAQVLFGEQEPVSEFVTVHVRGQAFARTGPSCELVGLLEGEAASFASEGLRMCGTGTDEPSAHVCLPLGRSRLVGELRPSGSEASIIGVIWGWEDARHFYLLQWGRAEQASEDCPAQRGIHLKRISADEGPVTRADLCTTDNRTNVTVLLGGFTGQAYAPWREGVEYRVELDHGAGSSRIRLWEQGDAGDLVVFDHSFLDASYPHGRFGLYLDGPAGLCGGPWTSACL